MKNNNIKNLALAIAISSVLTACGGGGDSTDSSTNTSIDPSLDTSTFVPDETAPVITLNGSSAVSILINDNYQDMGAIANDAQDGSVMVNQTGFVDTSTAGNYTIAYNAADSSGNAASGVTRTVTVIDGTPIAAPQTLYSIDYDQFGGFDFDKVVINETSISAAQGEIVNNVVTFPATQGDSFYSVSAGTWEGRNPSNLGFELVDMNTVGVVDGVRKLTIESIHDISGQLLIVGENEIDDNLQQGSYRYVIKTELLEDLYSVYNKISFNGVVPQSLSEVLTNGCGDTNLVDYVDSEQLTDASIPCSQSGQTAGTLTANTTTGTVVTDAGIWSIEKIPGSDIDVLMIKLNPSYLRADSSQLTEHMIFAIKDGEVWTGEMAAQGSVDIDAYFNQTAVQDRIIDGCFTEDSLGNYIDCQG